MNEAKFSQVVGITEGMLTVVEGEVRLPVIILAMKHFYQPIQV